MDKVAFQLVGSNPYRSNLAASNILLLSIGYASGYSYLYAKSKFIKSAHPFFTKTINIQKNFLATDDIDKQAMLTLHRCTTFKPCKNFVTNTAFHNLTPYLYTFQHHVYIIAFCVHG